MIPLANTDRLRIAIALTILKHKKPHESFTSYILDLQSKFTSSTESSVFYGTSDWRDYALKLERECADLKSKINLSQTKLLALSNTVAPGDLAGTTDTQGAIISDPTSRKKRMTANTGKRSDRHVVSNLNNMLAELADENHPTGREPAALFVALDHFAQLASLHELPDFPIDIFFSATQRVIHAASDALNSIILETNRNLNRLQVLYDLMRFMIQTSFLPLSSSESESFGYLLFNQLSKLLLLPVIHSFFPLSMKTLGYLLDPVSTNLSNRKGVHQKDIDLRPKLLEFFQGTVSVLFSASCSLAKTSSRDGFCQDASSMRDMLILETVRHLKAILSPVPVNNHTPDVTNDERNRCGNLNKHRRVRRLAVKDAIWYLCSVFHILVGSKTPDILSAAANSDNKSVKDMPQVGSEILEKTISQELFELLIDTRLCHQEKSWLSADTSQIPVGSPGKEARSHQNTIRREDPMQQILSSNKCFGSKREMDTRLFDHTNYRDSVKISNHGMEAVNGIVSEGSNVHHVFDDAERGMLLCAIEHYVNEK